MIFMRSDQLFVVLSLITGGVPKMKMAADMEENMPRLSAKSRILKSFKRTVHNSVKSRVEVYEEDESDEEENDRRITLTATRRYVLYF